MMNNFKIFKLEYLQPLRSLSTSALIYSMDAVTCPFWIWYPHQLTEVYRASSLDFFFPHGEDLRKKYWSYKENVILEEILVSSKLNLKEETKESIGYLS